MSKEDFLNGIRIAELDDDLAEKAERIRDKMKEETNNRKTGKAETGRWAIILADEYLDELEEEKQEKKEELAEYLRKVDKLVEELK